MLDPSLPWLAVGYKNFKQEDFCQRQIKDEMNKYRIDTTDVLRSTTPQCQQRRRVKSATHARFIPRCGSNSPAYTSLPARPKSAQSYHHKTTFAERSPSRQRRPRSAFLSHHRPSPAQNRSISMVEREHHEEKMIRLFVDEGDKKCAFCPVECRPKSSSSNRPTSSTGLVAAQLPTHYDRYVYCTRPRTAPATRREFLQLPRHNNIRRGQVPHYTNFVRRVELGVRDGTHSPPPRRQIAFENEPVKPQSPTFVESSHGDVEEEEMLPSVGNEEEEFDDVSIHIPSPADHLLVPEFIGSEEPPSDESQEAWTEPKAPTPSPAMSGRNSPIPVVDDTPEQPSPPPREPTPPPREPTPPPREPTPPLREPTPPPREPTPPPREPTPPPREPTPPPREPTPPPEPKPKKEVRIQETPILPPAKPKTVPQPTDINTKSCLVKRAEVPKEPAQKKPEPPVVPTPEVAPVEDEKPEEVLEVAVEEIEDEPQDEPREEQSEETRKPEKKKLGPAPKFKVDLFSMDSGAMKNILDMEMKLRRKGADTRTSDGDSFADIPEYLLKKRQPWQHGRMALSRRACRFEIPMDVFVLENMSPTEYLQQYCFVNKRRQAMYRRSFSKVDKDNDMKINMKEFNTAVLEALVGTVQLEQVQDVLKLIKADEFPHFGPKLFSAICSLLERLHYREFVTEDTVDKEGLVEKEKVEDADFLALDWKFDGCKINQPLKRLLYML